ncbi:hypothetical protein AGMMS49992_08430 [Clostridia bacterium]|nr:hypothetical protein AGMMS49992_08430 [Clostridia bacterium]
MAGRTNYTYTAIYNRSFAKPSKYPPESSYGRTYALEPLERVEESDGRSDTPVLALLFFVLPILGLFAILMQPMRWVFMAAALLSLLTMWGLKCFMPRARLITSVILTGLIALAIVGALASPGSTPYNVGGLNTLAGGDVQATSTPGVGSDAGVVNVDSGITDLDSVGVDTGESSAGVKSPAETVLLAYLELWKLGNNTEEMVKYTWPEWRRMVENPQFVLFSTYANRKMLEWEYTMPTVSDLDTVVTVPVVAKVQNVNGTTAGVQYAAMLYRVDDTWYVDPQSFRSGLAVVEATPTPDPAATPKPTPMVTVNPNTKLWYNSDNGAYYHTVKNCSTIAERYVSKMSSFTYSQLGEKKYSKLKPCLTCSAPARP